VPLPRSTAPGGLPLKVTVGRKEARADPQSGGSFPLGSLVGFISLFGISAHNSILLISHYEKLVQQEGMSWGAEAAIRGRRRRRE
jgi:Cu/Ag efflux pump CusA